MDANSLALHLDGKIYCIWKEGVLLLFNKKFILASSSNEAMHDNKVEEHKIEIETRREEELLCMGTAYQSCTDKQAYMMSLLNRFT